jgi:hypothetical protein
MIKVSNTGQDTTFLHLEFTDHIPIRITRGFAATIFLLPFDWLFASEKVLGMIFGVKVSILYCDILI